VIRDDQVNGQLRESRECLLDAPGRNNLMAFGDQIAPDQLERARVVVDD
jgi:hypothetical protein